MILKQLLSFFFLFILLSAEGQISLKAPRICHDKDGYLTSYFEGSYQMEFKKGNFQNLKSADSTFIYTDSNKTLTYYSSHSHTKEPVQLKLLPHSILITQGSKKTEIDTLPNPPFFFHDFQIGTYTVSNKGQGLLLWAEGDRNVEVEVWTFNRGWEWKIVARKEKQTLFIVYNSYRKNRIENLILMDDSLRRGMTASMTFKTLKKLNWLRSVYYYTDTINNISKTEIPGDNHYWYRYKKNGKLNKKTSRGEINICD